MVERAQVFPLQYRIREARAVILSTNEGIPPDIALKALDGLLEADPMAAQLLYLRIVQEARLGEPDYRSMLKLMDAMPESDWTRHAAKVLNELP